MRYHNENADDKGLCFLGTNNTLEIIMATGDVHFSGGHVAECSP